MLKKKKFCLFVFTLLVFFVNNSVIKAAYKCDGTICIQVLGQTGQVVTDLTGETESSWRQGAYLAYRFTFVDKDGNKIGNSVDYDITNYYFDKNSNSNYIPKGDVAPILGEYFITPKFNFSGNYSSSTSPKRKELSDFFEGKPVINTEKDEKVVFGRWKEKISNQIFLETLLSNAGIDSLKYEGTKIFATIEKIYTIQIVTYTKSEKVYFYQNYDLATTVCGALPEAARKPDGSVDTTKVTQNSICLQGYRYIRDKKEYYFRGTGSEVGYLIYLIDNEQSNKITGTPYNLKPLTDATRIFGKLLYVDNDIESEAKEWGLQVNENYIVSVEDKYNFSQFNLPHYGYNLGLVKIAVPYVNSCMSLEDANKLNRSWTGSACCDPGKIYNPITKECSGKKTYTPPGGTTNTYVYGCSPTADICKSNLDSTINNLGDGTLTVNSENETKLNSDNIGECVLYNDKYKVDYNGTTIYCSETLNTDFSNPFSGFSANFSGSYTNGKFIPINNMPSLNKKVTCYAPSNINTDVLKNYSKSFNNKTSNMEVSVNFLGSQTHKFSNNDITVKNISKISNAETTYGKTYNKIYFELEYDYSYSSASLNKYISIETALGSTTKIGTAQKTMLNDVNFKIPTGTASGIYTSSIKVNNLDNKISNISNETDHKKTFTSGSNPGYCVLTYNKKVSAATCTRKYNTYLNEGNVAGYEITYGKGQVDNAGIYPKSDCQFEIKYTGITEDYCESLPSDDTNISTEYHTTGNTTELEFKNTKIQPSLSCDFSFEVKPPIPDILVYRPIDLSNPFPGKDGSGRKIGVNWDVSDGELTYEQKYITNRQDVYTKTPLYSITLTTAQIKEIRNYNKENSYDDFLLDCKEKGSACYSDFIRKYLNTNKSVCANTNSQNAEAFNSCADYSKR